MDMYQSWEVLAHTVHMLFRIRKLARHRKRGSEAEFKQLNGTGRSRALYLQASAYCCVRWCLGEVCEKMLRCCSSCSEGSVD